MGKTLLATIVVSAALFAQSQTLEELRERFDEIEDFRVEVEQSYNGGSRASGTFYFRKPNDARLEFDDFTIVSDGETTWNYNKRENKVIVSDFVGDEPSAMTLPEVVNHLPAMCDVEETAEGELVFTPKAGERLSFQTVTLRPTDDDLVGSLAVVDLNGGTLTMTMKNYRVDAGVASSKFEFVAPEGARVIDLR
jgi:outer membrane lipoprotein-sorting protein